MPTLRLRLIGLFVVLTLVVAGVMFLAVEQFSADQIMHLAMRGGLSPEDAQAMFDADVGRVLLIGAGVGLVLSVLAAWWLLRRILRPLERVTDASRAIAAGDLAARVPEPPDPELRRLADAFNQMAASLERVEQLRRALVEDVAHELRTPLTSLQGYTEALADGVIEPTPEMLRTVHEEIVRLTRLVQELDLLARGERSSPPRPGHGVAAAGAGASRTDLAAVVRRAVAIATPELASRGIGIRLDLADDLPGATIDADAAGQVVANLMQNAARYASDRGEVLVRLVGDGPGVRCEVENAGPDIPPDELPFIWERLYRVDHSRSRTTGGSGIGLAIVREIVEAHGGEVGAASRGGRTTVWFRIPAEMPVAPQRPVAREERVTG